MARFYTHFWVAMLLVLTLSGCSFLIVPPSTQADQAGQTATGTDDSRAACPVSQAPKAPFIPPAPFPAVPPVDGFWHGTPALWTVVPTDGEWHDLPHNPTGYTQKILWWHEGYYWLDEPEPPLVVTGERLDRPAPALKVAAATNAFAEDIQSAMLVGVDFPTTGCWQITGTYRGTELSFVVWVAE